MGETINNKWRRVSWIGLMVIVAAVGAAFIFLRIIDADEGIYLSAGSLIAQGYEPYLDFFFPQMPNLPLFLAPFTGLGLDSLFISRALGFISHLALALMVYFFSSHLVDDRRIRFLILFLLIFSGPLLTWNSMAKPYFFCNIFLLASFIGLVLTLKSGRVNYFQAMLVFLLLGIAINARLLVVVLVPLYFFLLFFYFRAEQSFSFPKYLLCFLLGIIIPSLYSLRLLILSPEYFLFNNLGFHLLKENPLGFFDMLALKLTVLGKLLIQPHYLIPLGLSLWSVFILSSGRRRGEYSAWQRMVFHLALIVAGILAVFYFLPHPTLVQYYNQSLIFLIIASLPALRRLYAKAAAWRTIIPALYLLFFLLYPGLYILNIGSRYRDYKIDHVRRVVAFIKSHTLPEDVVLAEWVGYNIFSQRRQIQSDDYSGFQYVFSTNLVPYGRYRILTDEKVSQILARGEPRLVVIDNYVIPGWKTELEKKYRLLVQLDNTFIYELDLSKQSG